MIDKAEAFAPLDDDDIHRSRPEPPDEDPWRAILPVPEGTSPPTKTFIASFAPQGYIFTAGWRYLDHEGRLLGFVVRYDTTVKDAPADKEFRPFTFCHGQKGQREWRCKGFPGSHPLYGMDRLAARPNAPVLVTEGEKSADAASKRFPDHVVVTSPGGSKAAHKADWAPLAGRHVVIWPDHDDPGDRYADDVSHLLRDAGAALVRLVKLPDTFPEEWDLGDLPPENVSDADLVQMLAAAAAVPFEGPLPLFPPLPPAEPYPVQALGPVLARAAKAITRKVQVPEAIAAQSVLAAAALAAQAHADVLLPYGQTRPLSLYLVTIAVSGDRKSTADNEALWPVRKREKTLKEEHEQAIAAWCIAHTAWAAEKRKIEADKKLDLDSRKAELIALGPEPDRPLHPFLTAPDPTVEGLTKAWVSALPALGIFTAEGGQFIGSHGMGQESRLRTAATYSELWDGHPVKRIRAGDGVTILHGRRLSLHLLVQPEAAAQFLADPLLRDQGLLSRVLVASPDSIAGTRRYREVEPEDEAAIRAYGARLLSILEAPLPLADKRVNELAPRTLTISGPAEAAWRAFYDHVEGQCGSANDLAPVQDFAAKAAEHAARIAGVITIVEDLGAGEIDASAMTCGLALADWYVNEVLRLGRTARTDPRLLRAQHLLDWMLGRNDGVIGFREIVQFGPAAVRTKSAADDALAVLSGHGWIAEVSARPRRVRLVGGSSR